MFVIVVSKGFAYDFIEIRVMGEKNVTTHIPGKTGFIKKRRGKTADMIVAFKKVPVAVAKFIEMMGSTQATGTGTEDEKFQGL